MATEGAGAAARIAAAAQTACLLELMALKAGNVRRGRDLPGLTYRQFVLSALAIGPAFRRHAGHRVGRLILEAVRATRRHVPTNTNLGIVLLLAPLARAALLAAAAPGAGDRGSAGRGGGGRGTGGRGGSGRGAGGRGGSGRGAGGLDGGGRAPSPVRLRANLRRVLRGLDRRDARDAYRAIRLAQPGGLGRVREQDVASSPTVSLLWAMRLAAARDAIAREYATDFEATFETGLPTLLALRRRRVSVAAAIAQTHLTLLAERLDTLILRKRGPLAARDVSRRARLVLRAGGALTPRGRRLLLAFDRRLRRARPPLNPGATADLTVASLFAWLVGLGRAPAADDLPFPGGPARRTFPAAT